MGNCHSPCTPEQFRETRDVVHHSDDAKFSADTFDASTMQHESFAMFSTFIDFDTLRVHCKRAIEICIAQFANRRLDADDATNTAPATQHPGFLSCNGMGSLEIGATHD